MNENEKVIERFYAAFGQRDAEGMVACYDPEATFSDPVFPALKNGEPFAMWRMLCERAEGLVIRASRIEANEKTGKAHWDADYKFSATGRQVHNRIDARFVFRNGKIIEHVDAFDLWAWSAMALGTTGKLLGWSPIVRRGIRRKAGQGLRQYIEKRGASATAPVSSST